MVTLPTDVTEDNAKGSFKNGILEVRPKKESNALKSRIAIE
jgi:HSP20 family molecular chaperone IbpA